MLYRLVPSGEAFFGVRALLNAGLAGLAAAAAGAWAVPTAAVATLAGLSTLVMALVVLDVDRVGIRASYVELLAGLLVVPVAGYAVLVAGTPSIALVAAFVVVAALATLLALHAIPVYGDAFVAP